MKSLLIIALLGLVACGGNAKRQTISTTYATVNVAWDAFVVYDDVRQAAIVADATSLEQGQAELAAWLADRARMVEVFRAVVDTIAVAAMDASDHNIASMLAAVIAWREAYKSIVGKDP